MHRDFASSGGRSRQAGRLPPALLLAALPLAAGAASTDAQVPARKALVQHWLDGHYAQLDSLYRDIHAHPELGFAETRTASLLAGQMRALGFEVTERVGGTGLVAMLRNGSGPVVMVRTELDALPVKEATGLPYASQVQAQWLGREVPVAHACGHDIHMAAWVGTASVLAASKSGWRGTLMFVAQPAEEILGGATAMLKDGLFSRFPMPDFALALHTGPMAAGTVHYRDGVVSSNADDLVITFKGRGGHGSDPSATIDPVLMAARFVVDVQGVVSREKDPLQPGVVTIGAIEGGTAGNIIPEQVTVRGTIRNYDDAVRQRLKAGVVRVANATAAMAGAPPPDIAIGAQQATGVMNDPALVERIGPVFQKAFGMDASIAQRPTTASEDYSEFVKAGVPHSLFFNIGVHDPAAVAAAGKGGPPLPANHSPQFAPLPEPTIRTGVTAMSLAVLELLGGK